MLRKREIIRRRKIRETGTKMKETGTKASTS